MITLMTLLSLVITTPNPPSTVVVTAGGSVLALPDGSGETLADRGTAISIQVLDQNNQPVAGFPAQDVYLMMEVFEGQVCNDGASADAPTDANGWTTISGAIAGGGSTQNGMLVALAGVFTGSVAPIQVVSPDLDGSLSVGLEDVGLFSADFATPSIDFRIDFNHDDLEDLGDVAILAASLGASCP